MKKLMSWRITTKSWLKLERRGGERMKNSWLFSQLGFAKMVDGVKESSEGLKWVMSRARVSK